MVLKGNVNVWALKYDIEFADMECENVIATVR